MRIALVHLRHRGTGGTERYLDQMAAHLAALGHEVTIVCRSHEQPPHPAVRFVVLRNIVIGGAWRNWAFARAVARHVRASNYDVVFDLGRGWAHDVVWLGGGCHGTFIDLVERTTLKPWQRYLGSGLFRNRVTAAIEARAFAPGTYEHVITNSEMVRRDVMQRYDVPPERVTVIRNGVDLQRFHPSRHQADAQAIRAACGISPADFVVLFLGTGYRRKGLSRVIEAFPAVVRARPHARLVVVGYDSAQASFEQEAARLHLGDRVRFLGGRRDAEACYAAADLYVLPTHYDPAAYSTLEASASGLPVVTTETNGGSEILTAGMTGSILRATDGADALSRELVYWSEGTRARDARAAARALAEEYPEDRMRRAATEILETAAARRSARRASVR